MERICHANINQKKIGVAISIPDKIDFRAKTNKKRKTGTERTLRKDESINLSRSHRSFKCGCTKQQLQKCEAKLIEVKGKIEKPTIIVKRLQYPFLNN